jgi:hypothetical protein
MNDELGSIMKAMKALVMVSSGILSEVFSEVNEHHKYLCGNRPRGKLQNAEHSAQRSTATLSEESS